ncbi:DEAD/DEAH box helicase [Hymenobacter tenuis]
MDLINSPVTANPTGKGVVLVDLNFPVRPFSSLQELEEILPEKPPVPREAIAAPAPRKSTRAASTNRKPLSRIPAEAELDFGQVTTVFADKGYGFLWCAGSNDEIFWNIKQLQGVLPGEKDWLLVADQPSSRHAGKREVRWAQPLVADLPLLVRLLRGVSLDLLLRLLNSPLPDECRAAVIEALIAQFRPITDSERLTSATRLLDAILRNAPESGAQAIETYLGIADPEFAWQLWVRYRSPLREVPAVAARIIQLFLPLPVVVASWWPLAEETGITDLYLGFVRQQPAQEMVTAWQQLKAALGKEQYPVFDAILLQWVQQLPEVTSLQDYQQGKQAIALTWGDQTGALQLLVARLNKATLLEAWLVGDRAVPFPHDPAVAQFAALSPANQKKVAAQLSDEDFLTIARFLTAASPELLHTRAQQMLPGLIGDTFAVIAVDLESDQKTIREMAWGRPGAWRTGKGETAVSTTVATLAEHTATTSYLAVGHNVRDFDAPILADHGVTLAAENLWDTLLVEMALSPELQVYALRTSHTAAADAELAWHLFLNQVQRLLLAEPTEWEMLQGLFSHSVSTALAGLRSRLVGTACLAMDDFELRQQRLEWFRPQPVASPLLVEMQATLAEEGLPPVQLALAPSSAWGELSRLPGLRFFANKETDPEYRELDEDAVQQQLSAYPTEAIWAARFFAYCRQASLVPTAAAMAPAVRVRLRQYLVLAECQAEALAPDWSVPGCCCLTAEQLLAAYPLLKGQPSMALLIIRSDLLTLTHKKLLRDALGIHDLLASPSTRSEWLKFSGGQSFVGLTHSQATELRAEIPVGYEHFWLEKRRYGSFRVWGSFSWEALVAQLPGLVTRLIEAKEKSAPTGQLHIEGIEQSAPKGRLRSIAVDAFRLQQRLGVTPFYPESIYRARYWLLQAELVDSISRRQQGPLVLLATRSEEVAVLARFFEQRGYFVPDSDAPVARQLELLHDSRHERRLLVASAHRGAALLRANYRGPIELLLDGFALGENYFLAQNTALFERARLASGGKNGATMNSYSIQGESIDGQVYDDKAAEEDDEASVHGSEPADFEYLTRDTHFLLQLQRPVVNHWQELALHNHVDNRVWLLDPRLSETPGIVASWGLQVDVLDTPWHAVEDYQQAANKAETVFGSGQPDAEFELDIDEAKELLQLVFLQFWDTQQKQLVQHEWRADQLPYLDRILPAPANLSLLVSLPTGGGKSLLFQAPALYRSAYTNRLSIVVTPLKALMEDQVSALWQRGFYSSVEYLNQDKQDEVQQIYSRLAGGEIMLLFITPERFRSRSFARAFAQRLAADGGLEYAIFDEAHCISQWGHEFRPDYLHAARMVQGHRDTSVHKFPVLLFSATVTEKIYEGFTQLFG